MLPMLKRLFKATLSSFLNLSAVFVNQPRLRLRLQLVVSLLLISRCIAQVRAESENVC